MASQHVVLTDKDIPHLREEWMDKIDDLVSGIPLELLPLREVNHEINLVDPMKRIRYRLPKCPENSREDLSAKIERYTTAEWWVPAVAHQGVPMLCVGELGLGRRGRARRLAVEAEGKMDVVSYCDSHYLPWASSLANSAMPGPSTWTLAYSDPQVPAPAYRNRTVRSVLSPICVSRTRTR
jgi:hypothetical protein